jgi:exosortase K
MKMTSTASKVMVVAGAALIAWSLKRHYADARPDDLLWMLTPTAWLAGSAAGATFAFVSGEGYLSREHLFLIEKSCAGVNFMVAALGVLVCTLLHHASGGLGAARVLGVGLVGSYAAAVLVNATRVAIAMWLSARPAPIATLSADAVHRIEGVAVYFGGLVLLYELVRALDPTADRR